MKPKGKILSLLLASCLVAGLMPTAVFATGTDTGKAIQLVDSETAANIGGEQADNLYFGTYQQSSDGNGGYNTCLLYTSDAADEARRVQRLSIRITRIITQRAAMTPPIKSFFCRLMRQSIETIFQRHIWIAFPPTRTMWRMTGA